MTRKKHRQNWKLYEYTLDELGLNATPDEPSDKNGQAETLLTGSQRQNRGEHNEQR